MATDIASEGEQRCIALAAFLTELSQASHASSLVFDDPVSSLDHWHREKIAYRLVKESKDRQVIVFTHDAVFLQELKESVQGTGHEPTIWYLEWIGASPGRCVKGLPWVWKSAGERLNTLEKKQTAIAKTWGIPPSAENIQAMHHVYSLLRATLERFIEQEVLGDVVFRFRSQVKTGFLDRVVGFESQHCKEIQRLVKKCHDVTDAHDPPAGKHATIPNPSDLAKDIEGTKSVREKIKQAKKGKS